MSGSASAPRPEIATLPEYRAGRPAAAAPGLTPLKLSSNERSDAISAERRLQLLSACEFHRYPDPVNGRLRGALARRLAVPSDRIVTESGSLGALRLLFDAVIERDGARVEVVHPWRSFEAYPILIAVAGATAVPVPLAADGANDLPAISAAITPRTRAVLLCSPNNPTGPVLDSRTFARFMAAVPEHVLVIIDEAYAEYVDDPHALDGMTAFRRYPNVAVLRTFSKAHGLAGLRIGYAVVAPELAAAMWRIRPTFAVTALAEEAAILALDDVDGLARHVGEVQRGRSRILAALRERGLNPPSSQANFVWFEPADPAGFEAAAARAAIAVRRLGDGIRITIGDAAATERVLALIDETALR